MNATAFDRALAMIRGAKSVAAISEGFEIAIEAASDQAAPGSTRTRLTEAAGGNSGERSAADQATIDDLATVARSYRKAMLPKIEGAATSSKPEPIGDDGILAGIIENLAQWVSNPNRDLPTVTDGEIVVARLKSVADTLQKVLANPTADNAVTEATDNLDLLVGAIDLLATGETDGKTIANHLQYQESWAQRRANRRAANYDNRFDAAGAHARTKIQGGASSALAVGAPSQSGKLIESRSDGNYETRFAESVARAKEKLRK